MFKMEEKEGNNNNNVDLHHEAKHIVMEEMEKMGLISKMRAQIKSSVLNILEKQKQSVRQNVEFDYLTSLNKMNKSKEVLLACHLIKEFLQFYEMEYTIPVFENESNIRENIKKDFLVNELSLQNFNLTSTMTEPKPILLQLILAFQQEMVKKHNDNLSQKLDDSYGVKGHNYPSADVNFVSNKPESGSLPNLNPGKKQLAPISFANKSIDMKENSSPSNKSSNESLKFNTANINDIYTHNQNENIKSSLNNEDNKQTINENKEESQTTREDLKYQFNSSDYSTNNKYDEEFNEVILEEINEGKNVFAKNKEEDIEDSKKSVTANSANNILSSMGYDSSITNYKLDEFDHVEDVEKP